MRTLREALSLIRKHGVVLESAKGPVPNLAEAIVGAPIKGGWWSHPQGNLIFNLTREVRDHRDILTCRLVDKKITFVHRRCWPALVRLSKAIGARNLAAIREVHTRGGAHRTVLTPFPKWVPVAVRSASEKLSEDQARRMLGLLRV